MYNDITAALEHMRDAAHLFIEAVDEFVEQGRAVTPGELAIIDRHWQAMTAARSEYDRAVDVAGIDRTQG